MRSPTFVPAAEALRAVARDLRIYPSLLEHPQRPMSGQVAAFNRDGYLTGTQMFDEGEIADT